MEAIYEADATSFKLEEGERHLDSDLSFDTVLEICDHDVSNIYNNVAQMEVVSTEVVEYQSESVDKDCHVAQLPLKSEYYEVDTDDEMERQYVSFDDDNVEEEVVTTEPYEEYIYETEVRNEDPVEKEMRFIFEDDRSMKVVKKTPKRSGIRKGKQKRNTDKRAPLVKSVQKFLQPRKSLPVVATPPPKRKQPAVRYHTKNDVQPEVTEKRPRVRPKEVTDSELPDVKLSFKDLTPLRCIVCQADCANKRDLIAHVKSHSRDKNSFECPECQKTFAQQCNLKRHMRCHSGERPFTCPYCQKLFSDQGYLTTHLRYHTNTKPYTCTQCKKPFFDRSNYIKHLRSHTGEKPYSCKTCNKSFLQQSDLTRHSRTHSGERPFKCTYCERAFTQHGDLTNHLRHHTGERPFSCNKCKKTFANKRYLNSHVRGQICDKWLVLPASRRKKGILQEAVREEEIS